MRLTFEQRERIVGTIRDRLGAGATVWLYGSRTADDRRGGDVDLLVKTQGVVAVMDQAAIQARLERELSLPVDISFIDPRQGMNRFQRLAAANALPVEVSS